MKLTWAVNIKLTRLYKYKWIKIIEIFQFEGEVSLTIKAVTMTTSVFNPFF